MVDKILADHRQSDRDQTASMTNFIGGTWVPAGQGQQIREYFADRRSCGLHDCPFHRGGCRTGARCGALPHGRLGAAPRRRSRAQTLLRIADRIEQKLDLLALVETIDNGKPIRQPRRPTCFGDRSFPLFAGCLRAQEGSISEIDHDTVALSFSMSRLAVVAQIIPWNFPILMAVWKLAPALAAGNCVVLKRPSRRP